MRQPGDGALLDLGQLAQTQVGEVPGRQGGGLGAILGAGLLSSPLPPSNSPHPSHQYYLLRSLFFTISQQW